MNSSPYVEACTCHGVAVESNFPLAIADWPRTAFKYRLRCSWQHTPFPPSPILWANRATPPHKTGLFTIRKIAHQVIFSVAGRGELLVEADQLVLAGWPTPQSRDLALLNHGLLLWLESKRHPVLHGACLAKQQGAVALLAESGQGKSTFSAALTLQGCQLLSDYVFALYSNPGQPPSVFPGPPHARLTPDSAAALRVPWPTQADQDGKLKIWPSSPAVSSHPLKAICLLHRRLGDVGPPHLIPLNPSAALLALTQHSYLDNAAYILHPPDERLAMLAQVVEQIPVVQWNYPSGFDRLPEVSQQFIEQLWEQS